jgi:hypothetical protein
MVSPYTGHRFVIVCLALMLRRATLYVDAEQPLAR